MKIELISIVIPVYNSKNTLSELCSRIDKTLNSIHTAYELILVDDGSADGSWEEIEKIKSTSLKTISGIKLAKNYGQHNAILCGFNFCKGDVILTMDDDLQHPPEEITKLISKYNETNADVVYGMPIDKKASTVRKAGSYYVRKTSEHSTTKVNGGSSFRLIKRALTDIIKNNHHHNFLFVDSILGWYTGNLESVEVEHHERKSGKSGYTTRKLIVTYLNVIINYSAGPLKVLTYGGLIASIFSFILGLRFIYKKLFHDVPLGYTSLIVSILFSTGLILFCLGVIGQYLYKLYQLQNKRPPYSIDKQIQ